MTDDWRGWAIVNLVGRRRLAGYVASDRNSPFLRVDMPREPEQLPIAFFVHRERVQGLVLTTEAIARAAVADA